MLQLLPPTATPDSRLLLAARGLRAASDGFVSIILPAYLLLLGFDALHVGVLATATLLGSALLTLAVGFTGVRRHTRTLLIAASLLMVLTGLGFAAFVDFWPLLVIASVGTLNPSSGDVSVFLPLEHALLAGGVAGHDRTALFARYSLVGAPAAAPKIQTVSDCRHAADQPIVAHCARVRARENGDGERSKEEQPRGQKAQG